MSTYIGSKALDAEIIIDFSTNDITYDYSGNTNGNPFNSSRSATLKSDWKTASPLTKLRYVFQWEFLQFIFVFPFAFYMPIMTWLGHKQLLTAKWQYRHQKFLKWYYTNLDGISTNYEAGKIDKTTIVFKIPTNIWFEYLLNGDYKKKIKTISLKRNFEHFEMFGKFEEIRQNGWNVIFEFTEPPNEGFCEIHYVK